LHAGRDNIDLDEKWKINNLFWSFHVRTKLKSLFVRGTYSKPEHEYQFVIGLIGL
jgi:hypothetical protein